MNAAAQPEPTPERRASRSTELLREFVDHSHAFQRHIEELTAVNPTDRAVMEELLEHGPQSPSRLARAVGITPAAMTTSLDRLEALGHATRGPHANDRRQVVVAATPESTRVIMTEVMSMVGALESIQREFTAEEMTAVTRFLERAVAVYSRATD
jgi:DNA-binding MarR family transcriptional regulator